MKIYKNINVIILISLSIIIGILSITFLPKFPITSDSLDYENIAKHILHHGEYTVISSENIIYPPLYPIFLAIIYAFTDNPHSLIFFIQFILAGIIGVCIYLIANKHLKLNKWYSTIAGAIVIFWPYFILYSLLLSSEILFIAFLIISIYFLLNFLNNSNTSNSLLFSIFMGLAVLTRPVALLLPFWIFCIYIILHHMKFINFSKEQIKKGLLILILFIITLLPWTIYVYAKYDKFIPIASNLSYVFNKGNKTLEYLGANIEKSNNDFSLGKLLKAKVNNVFLFWNPGASGYHVDGLVKNNPRIIIGVTIYKIGFFLILILVLMSFKWFRDKKEIQICIIIVLYFWALHTVLFPFPRYTLPVIPIVILLAIYSTKYMIDLCQKKF